MKKIISVLLTCTLISSCVPLIATAEENIDTAAVSGYVSTTSGEGKITLVDETFTPAIYVDNTDYEGVVRAVGDLKEDITSVTEKEPTITDSQQDATVIVGTIGKSAAINTLVDDGKLDVSDVEGKWESFTIQNVDGVLVIAGSDKRGTIYGIYDLSEKIGVSPWNFWADTDSGHADSLYIDLPDSGYTEGEPSVKYRGIFLNDEYNMSQWSTSMGNSGKNMNNETYEKIFELLLRLKANYLWPAMHEYSTAFNVTENNAKLADMYGIVMGSSHSEPLLRNNLGELYTYQQEWIAENPDKPLYINTEDDSGNDVSWMWTDKDSTGQMVYNKEFLTDYWRTRVEENNQYENTYTLGMRGVHDGRFNTNMDQKTAMTEIIAAQTQILTDTAVQNGQDISDVPQIFIPYKEMLDLYNDGLEIPDYVTLMWPDDNFGYIRQLPTEAERERSGGGGIYYHLSYFGRPTSYLWLGTTQLGLIREEMTKAYDMGAQRVWVANVGDLKPAETEVEYFLDLARDVESVRNTEISDWLKNNAKRDFGFNDTQAEEYADIKLDYYEIANSRRPEHMTEGTYSLTNFGDEGQKVLDKYNELESRAETLYNSLSDAKKPSFYELMLYPIRSASNMAEKYISTDKANQYNSNNWGSAVNKYAAKSDAAYDSIVSDTNEYNSILGGKWDKMMNPFQRQLTGSFGGPISGKLTNPSVSSLSYTDMEIVPEGNDNLSFTHYSTEPRFIDIINTGSGKFDWTASTTAPWITINKTSGTVADNDRIHVGVDLSKAEYGTNSGTITFEQYIGDTIIKTIDVTVTLNNSVIENIDEKTYVESDGYVSIEAENYSQSITNGEYEWKIEKDFGRSDDSVKIYPNTAKNVSSPGINNSAYLEYNVYFTSVGTFPIDVYRMPTLNELSGSTMRCRIGIDDETPVQFNGTTKTTDNSTGTDSWGKGVLQNTEIISGTITVSSPGLHTIRLYNESAGFVLDKFVITTGEKVSSYYGAPESYNTTYNNGTITLPQPSQPSSEQTGDIAALFEPKALITNVQLNTDNANEGIETDGITMTVTLASSPSKDAQCYVAVYNSNGTLSQIAKSNNTILTNSDDRVFTFDTAFTEPSDGYMKAFIWTEDMEPAYNTLTMKPVDETDSSETINTDIVKIDNIENCIVVAASYDDKGNMIDFKYTTADLADTEINQSKSIEIVKPNLTGACEVQIMALSDLTDYDAIAPAVTVSLNNISLMASYENGYAYPSSNLKPYIGKESVCVISEDDSLDSSGVVYIRQNTVDANTYSSIPFNKQGKFELIIKIAGDDTLTETLSTIKNITTDTDEITTNIYSQTFDSQPADGKVTITSPAIYDSTFNCVKMTSENTSGGAVTVDLGEAIETTQGDKITISADMAHGELSGKYMNYDIIDSNGNSIVSIKINRYNDKASSIKIGGAEQIEDGGQSPSSIPKIDRNNSNPTGKYATYTATIDISTKEVTLVINNTNKYSGKLPDTTSYDLQKLNFTTDYNNSSRTCYIDNISVSKTKGKSYTMSFIPTVSGTEIEAENITVTDSLTGNNIAAESDGTYKLCDGTYSYTILAGGKTVTNTLELSTATESKILLVDMETGAVSKPSEPEDKAHVTIEFKDTDGNYIKDSITVSDDLRIGDSYTVPKEYLRDFVMTVGDVTSAYQYVSESSTISSESLEKDNIFTLVYNILGTYSYYEDYESYDVSSHNWKSGAQAVKPTIVTDNGNSYLNYVSNGNTHGAYELFNAPINCQGKEVTINADLKFAPAGTAGNSQFTIGSETPTFSSNQIDWGYISGSNGHIIAFEYKKGKTFTVNNQSISTDFIGNWMHMTANINFNTNKINITLSNDSGNTVTLNDLDFYSSDAITTIGSYYIRAAKPNGTVCVDNLTIQN